MSLAQAQSPASYAGPSTFGRLAVRGYLLVGSFMLLFYLLCLLNHNKHLSISACQEIAIGVWLADLIYVCTYVLRKFPELYRFILQRMRLYRKLTWIIGFYVLWACLLLPVTTYSLL